MALGTNHNMMKWLDQIAKTILMLYNKTTLGLSREKPLEKFFDILTRVKGLPFLHLVDINYIYILVSRRSRFI